MRGFSLYGVRCRRRSNCSSLKLRQRCGRRGDAEARDHARHEVGVFPPCQAACRGAGAETLQAAAERDDSAGQFRPLRMSRPNATAEAHRHDRITERAADRRGLGLRRARRQVRPSVRPPEPRPAAAEQAPGGSRAKGRANGRAPPACARMPPDRADLRRRGRLRPEWGVGCALAPLLRRGGGASQALFS
jgi:hypothetical protein